MIPNQCVIFTMIGMLVLFGLMLDWTIKFLQKQDEIKRQNKINKE